MSISAPHEVSVSTPHEVSVLTPHEVSDSAPPKNKTEKNNTYRSKTISNPISSYPIKKGQTGRRADEIDLNLPESGAAVQKRFEQLIRDNIRYDDLMITHAQDSGMINGLMDIILETLLSTKDQIQISGEYYPAQLVKNKLMKLEYFHIEYILDCLRNNSSKVKKMRSYMLTTMFNAPSTIDGYYQAEVNYGMMKQDRTD